MGATPKRDAAYLTRRVSQPLRGNTAKDAAKELAEKGEERRIGVARA